MRINGNSSEPIRPERPSAVAPISNGVKRDNPNAPSGSSAPTTDTVQFSAAGRALASRLQAKDELNPERVAEYRSKVLTGAYNSLDVVDQVARRIMTRGDL